MKEKIKSILLDNIENPKIKDFLSNLVVPNLFYRCSGSSKPEQHHYGNGGLVKHTHEVLSLCLQNGKAYNLDLNVLLTAAFFHDWGKMWDYEQNQKSKEWFGSEHKRYIHHISRSAIEFNMLANKANLSANFIDSVTHCILSHHGRREWGSPVAPKSREAWMLHLCDGISARMDDCLKIDCF